MTSDPHVGCPTPQKVIYKTEAAAQFFARAQGNRPYQCPCGNWHLSSQNVRRHRPPDKR